MTWLKASRFIFCILTLICTYIILRVGLGWFWAIGSSDNHEHINQVLINLSYSYMAGIIFYILIEFIPKHESSKKAFLIWEDGLTNIFMNMSTIIAAIKIILNIDKINSAIKKSDLQEISQYNSKFEKIYYRSRRYINHKGNYGEVSSIFIYHEDLPHLASQIKKLIAGIVHLPCTSNIEIGLIEIISSIDSSKFLRTCISLEKSPVKFSEVTIHNFDEALYEFIKLYRRLGRYNFRKHSYTYQKLTNQEIVDLKAKKRDYFKTLQMSNILQQNARLIHNDIEYIIKNGKLRE